MEIAALSFALRCLRQPERARAIEPQPPNECGRLLAPTLTRVARPCTIHGIRPIGFPQSRTSRMSLWGESARAVPLYFVTAHASVAPLSPDYDRPPRQSLRPRSANLSADAGHVTTCPVSRPRFGPEKYRCAAVRPLIAGKYHGGTHGTANALWVNRDAMLRRG